ncbi:hypothetical protein NLJ89_g6723 [Agrocybe chaxingu]|uniref:Uncharacterized protein n=1 Tax=Agrocybe chaxingu TaxID=84603 RepID=A0A9W8JVX8_9AGAR|nr:hypothetical protein NLJ89_g6723 [Agrocybe chaxingu]
MSTLNTFRIVESEEEASLHPRAIWNHWKKRVLWDHRTYYGILEFIGVFIVVTALNIDWILALVGLMLLVAIAPLHWYSNQRDSTHILTRTSSHFFVLITLTIVITAIQIYLAFHPIVVCGDNWCRNEDTLAVNRALLTSIPFLLAALFVLYRTARHPPKDPLLAELPSPIDVDEEAGRRPWIESNVADGIEDDSPEPVEGQVRLT